MRKLDLQHFSSAPPPDLTRKIIEKKEKKKTFHASIFLLLLLSSCSCLRKCATRCVDLLIKLKSDTGRERQDTIV